MKRTALAFLALCCLLLIAPLTPPASAKDTWMSVRSKNFFLVSNANEKEIKRVATRLEQFRDVLGRLLKSGDMTCGTRKPENPVIVIYRPSKNARAKTNGQVLAVSFVTKEMLENK